MSGAGMPTQNAARPGGARRGKGLGQSREGRGRAHRAHAINDGRLALDGLRARLLADKRPELVEIYHGAEELVHRLVEVSHADLAKVARMAARGRGGAAC